MRLNIMGRYLQKYLVTNKNCRKMTTCQRLCQNKTHRCKRDGRNDAHLTCELNCRKEKKKKTMTKSLPVPNNLHQRLANVFEFN